MTKRTVQKRFEAHLYEARVKKYNMYLHNAIRFHGPDAFSIELIEEVPGEMAALRERHWIRELNTIQPYGYNEHEGGQGGCLNASDELRAKLSAARMGKEPWNKGYSGNDLKMRKLGLLSFFPSDRPVLAVRRNPSPRRTYKPRARWYNNGTLEAKYEGGLHPEGWLIGRLPKKNTGRRPWSTGLNKHNSEAVANMARRLSKTMKGRAPWNKGLQNSLSAGNGKKGAEAQRARVTGRKRYPLPDGSWTWIYPDGTVGRNNSKMLVDTKIGLDDK